MIILSGVKGLAQGPNTDLVMAKPGVESPSLQVPVRKCNHSAIGCPESGEL